jgi:PadR family transcriptional regulator PadR
MRRKPNDIIPIELSILEAGISLAKDGASEFHGFLIAKGIKERDGARLLTAYGTLYKALDRMEDAGLLASRWEDPTVAAAEARPRRRYYSVTTAGARALATVEATARQQGALLVGKRVAVGAPSLPWKSPS